MKLTIVAAIFLSKVGALGSWGECPDIPVLDDGSEDREIDDFG
jgi:hypothetical protein